MHTPFIPKTNSLLLTTDETMLVWHVLRQYINRRAPYIPQSKHNDLHPASFPLVKKLDTHLELSKCQGNSESFSMQNQQFGLNGDESLLVWQAFSEYSIRQRHELSLNSISLMQKILSHLGALIQGCEQREVN
jgi:hypothetical protein